MNLSSRLDKLLERNNLAPVAQQMEAAEVAEPTTDPVVTQINDVSIDETESSIIYEGLTEAIAAAESLKYDEFGTRLAKVRYIDCNAVILPLEISGYIVDDIQRRKDGVYDIHIVESSKNNHIKENK